MGFWAYTIGSNFYINKENNEVDALRNIFAIFSIVLILGCTGCQSSLQKRAQTLALGIQRAYAVDANKAARLSPMIIQSATRYQLPPELLAALIQQESSYRSQAVSPVGALGLTQVQPRYWQTKCPGNLLDERTNIDCGAMILALYRQNTNQHRIKSLAYYNVGPSGYEQNHKQRKAGKRYAKAVLTKKKILKAHL